MNSDGEYLRVGEVARILSYTRSYVEKLCRLGRIPGAVQPTGPRGQWRIPRHELRRVQQIHDDERRDHTSAAPSPATTTPRGDSPSQPVTPQHSPSQPATPAASADQAPVRIPVPKRVQAIMNGEATHGPQPERPPEPQPTQQPDRDAGASSGLGWGWFKR